MCTFISSRTFSWRGLASSRCPGATQQWITKSSRPAFLTSLDSPLDPLATRSAPFGPGPDGLNSPGQDRILEPRQRSEQIEGFPFTDQKSSPLATLQGNTDASIARLKAELDHLREGIERRDDRAGDTLSRPLSPFTSLSLSLFDSLSLSTLTMHRLQARISYCLKLHIDVNVYINNHTNINTHIA